MKFRIEQTELNNALQNLVRNTDAKMPTLENIKIEQIDTNTISLQANNCVVAMEYRLNADNIAGEAILVNARRFADIVARLNGMISFDDGVIKCGNSRLKLDIALKDNFMPFEKLSTLARIVPTDKLQQAIKNRLFACDKLGSNVLSGVYFNNDEIASCNGNILSVGKLGFNLNKDFIVDSRMALELVKNFNQDTLNISLDKNKIMLSDEKVTIVSVLLQGDYPKYKQLVPVNENEVTLNKNDILPVLDLLKVLVDLKAPTCKFDFSKDKLTIATVDGDNKNEIDIKYDGEPMAIGFNIDFMRECLRNIDNDNVLFTFASPLNACLIKGDNEFNLIMPVQMRG